MVEEEGVESKEEGEEYRSGVIKGEAVRVKGCSRIKKRGGS